MSTILFPSPIYGPVKSRRLGISLGINLMPAQGKICTFDCIYCECGYNADGHTTAKRPTRDEVKQDLEQQLKEMADTGQLPDVITFAGNGEPTAHPHFAAIIHDTIALRNQYCPKAKIAVLSNATQLDRPEVVEALKAVDDNILKLDTVNLDFIRLVDQPVQSSYHPNKIAEQMKQFAGHLIIQTIFFQGEHNGQHIDNTTPLYVEPWIETLKAIQPESVMIYTIDRETPEKRLQKASTMQLDHIAQQVEAAGFKCSVSY